jgi:hypothetical protein
MPPSVHRLVPFAHVASVDAALSFYALLGFEPQHVLKDPSGRAFWAMAESGDDAAKAEIMFAQSSGPINAAQQAVLFYMYTKDVEALRRHLLSRGVRDGGRYSGAASPHDAPGMVYHVSHPAHMPAGELRVVDPNGYIILVGQLQ